MCEGKSVTPKTNNRKRRRKSSFRYSTMKELKNAREYKKSVKKSSDEPSNVAKTLEYPRKLMKKLDTIINSSLK
jgi:hypothetical protein